MCKDYYATAIRTGEFTCMYNYFHHHHEFCASLRRSRATNRQQSMCAKGRMNTCKRSDKEKMHENAENANKFVVLLLLHVCMVKIAFYYMGNMKLKDESMHGNCTLLCVPSFECITFSQSSVAKGRCIIKQKKRGKLHAHRMKKTEQ